MPLSVCKITERILAQGQLAVTLFLATTPLKTDSQWCVKSQPPAVNRTDESRLLKHNGQKGRFYKGLL
jgi:hypothetical protein